MILPIYATIKCITNVHNDILQKVFVFFAKP